MFLIATSQETKLIFYIIMLRIYIINYLTIHDIITYKTNIILFFFY